MMNAVLILSFALLCLLSWAVSVAIASWDIFRRGLTDREKFVWLALVALLPFAGFLAYWAARGLEWIQSDSARPSPAPPKRVTLDRPEPELWSPTIPAADLDRSDWLEPSPVASMPGGSAARGAEVFEIPNVEARPAPPFEGAVVEATLRPASEALLEPDLDGPEAEIEAAGEVEYQQTIAAPPSLPIVPEAPSANKTLNRIILTAAQGPYSGAEFILQEFPAVLGRGPRAGIRLDEDLSVSRRHAEILVREGRPWINDLESVHGTFVNDQQVSDHRLKIGDKIQVGMTVLLFVHEERGTIKNVDAA